MEEDPYWTPQRTKQYYRRLRIWRFARKLFEAVQRKVLQFYIMLIVRLRRAAMVQWSISVAQPSWVALLNDFNGDFEPYT